MVRVGRGGYVVRVRGGVAGRYVVVFGNCW